MMESAATDAGGDAAETPLRLASRVEVAETFRARLRGLKGRSLGEEEGLYLTPCRSVHTFGMDGPIDVVFLDGKDRALALYHSLPPRRATRWIPRARGALELPAGTLARRSLRKGQTVWLDGASGRPARDTATRIAVNLLLSAFWFYLASRLAPAVLRGEASPAAYMLFAVNTLIALLFLIRREEKRVTESVREKLITIISVLMSFSLRMAPGSSALPAWSVTPLLTLSLLTIFLAYISLGRSFGLVPADRGLRLDGLYRWVRHPLYGAEMLFFLLFLLANFTFRNAAFVVAIFVSLDLRARAEERLLSENQEYRDYCGRVRTRYIPFLV
ncbi:MAG: DUF192 domain-containing protein [bacterium]